MDNAISILVAGNSTAYKNGKKLINVTDFVKAIYVSATSTKLITNNALDEVTITHATIPSNSGVFQDLVQDAVELAYQAPGSIPAVDVSTYAVSEVAIA
tara:strand:+ start:44 stop:340 length:297 start_codon:yes stop_codon:yes gene_type:complete